MNAASSTHQHCIQPFQKLGISEAVDYDKYYLYSLITHSTAIELSLIHICGGQAVGEAHRLGQPAQHGDVGAGLSEGGADIDQQDKEMCIRDSRCTAPAAQYPFRGAEHAASV